MQGDRGVQVYVSEFLYFTNHVKLGILWELNLFTELKNLERFQRYDFAKTGRMGPVSAICMEN